MPAESLVGYEGPRRLKEAEVAAAGELVRSIFFPQGESLEQVVTTWPMALHPEYAQGTLAMFHQGKPVSLVSRLERGLVVYGHTLRMGFIGSVCTHPEHRGRGLARTVLAASLNRFHANGVDFVYISGARPLYYATGANHIGGRIGFRFSGKNLVEKASFPVHLRAAISEEAALLSELQQREPVRFVRPREDYELVLRHGHCSGQPCQFQILEKEGAPSGYLLITPPREEEGGAYQPILEYGGDRSVIEAALANLAAKSPPGPEPYLEVHPGDPLEAALRARGAEGELTGLGGTVKALDFARTMRRLQPYFESRLGRTAVGSMQTVAGGERYVIHTDQALLEIEGETNLLWTLLGTPPGKTVEKVRAIGVLQDLVTHCLPLPLPALHLNMI